MKPLQHQIGQRSAVEHARDKRDVLEVRYEYFVHGGVDQLRDHFRHGDVVVDHDDVLTPMLVEEHVVLRQSLLHLLTGALDHPRVAVAVVERNVLLMLDESRVEVGDLKRT